MCVVPNMSSGIDLRKRVKRQDPPGHKKRKASSPLDAIEAGTPGEVKVSVDSMVALQHLYHTSPSIQAARQILMGQLLSSGVVVRRDGEDVKLRPVFSRHLEDQWIPFARTVIDHFLIFGFVVVSIEPEDPPAFANLLGNGKEVAALSNTREGPTPNRTLGGSAGQRAHVEKDQSGVGRAEAKKRPIVTDEQAAKYAQLSFDSTLNLIPFVPVSAVAFPIATTQTHPAYSRRTWASTTSPSSTSAPTATAASTASSPPPTRPPTARTTTPRSSSSRRPTRAATSSRPLRPSSRRRASSPRSRSSRSRPRSSARARCS